MAATVAMGGSLPGRDDQKDRLSRKIGFAAGRAEAFSPSISALLMNERRKAWLNSSSAFRRNS